MTQYRFDPIAADTTDPEDVLRIIIGDPFGDDLPRGFDIDHVASLEPPYDIPDTDGKKADITSGQLLGRTSIDYESAFGVCSLDPTTLR